ncbi:MAG: GGDEF domain-containing protein [Gammaproteobacteria bacterium]|nr:GGDEF domain-containing protein [Gammaproteobacteria bacterium]
MPKVNQLCYETLQKLALLTSIKDEECALEVFIDILMGKFNSLESVSLFKLERMYKETLSLRVQNSRHRNDLDNLNAEVVEPSDHMESKTAFCDYIKQIISKKPELDEYSGSYLGSDFLIKRVNQDKQIAFFMVYQFSGAGDVEAQCDSNSDVPMNHLSSSIQMMRCLSDIYSNQQNLISLNDKDALTGLYNRKFFDRKMSQLLQAFVSRNQNRRQIESAKGMCLAILDIDHFKKINDTYGHLYGDEVLLHFAQQMQKVFRDDDWLFRYGGEEFIVILKDVDVEAISKILHRFRTHIELYAFPKNEKVTISIGVTLFDGHIGQSEIVERADHALYYIKEHGRNNVGYYEELVRDGLIKEIVTHDDIELF